MPVYGSHLTADADTWVARRIRSERLRKHLTLQELSGMAGIPVPRLSQIENGRRIPNLRQAWALADALDIAVEALLPQDVKYPYQVTRDSDLKHMPSLEIPMAPVGAGRRRVHHSRFWPLAPLFVGRLVEPFLAKVMPLAESELRLYSHHHQEFAFVLKGTVEFRMRLPDRVVCETLTSGDSVYFKSDVPHCFRSVESAAATCLHVFSSTSAPFETGVDWLSPHAAAKLEGTLNRLEFAAQKMGELRAQRGWTLEELARVLKVKATELGRIERGTRSMPVSVLISLARTFGKPVRELIGPSGHTPPYHLLRSESMASLNPRVRKTPADRPGRVKAHATYYPMAEGFPDKLMFPYFVSIRTVEAGTLAMHEHHGQEFIYVLDGELELTMAMGHELTRQTLKPGDCCYIDASVPHLTRGSSRNPFSRTGAEVIDLFACPLGEAYLFERPGAAAATEPGLAEDTAFELERQERL